MLSVLCVVQRVASLYKMTNFNVQAMATAHLGYSKLRLQHTSATAHLGYSTTWLQHTLATAHLGYSTPRLQHTLATAHLGYSTPWLQHTLATAHLGYSTPRLRLVQLIRDQSLPLSYRCCFSLKSISDADVQLIKIC